MTSALRDSASHLDNVLHSGRNPVNKLEKADTLSNNQQWECRRWQHCMQEPVNEQGTSSSVRTIVGSPQETGRMFGVSRGSARAAQIGGVGGVSRPQSLSDYLFCSLDSVRAYLCTKCFKCEFSSVQSASADIEHAKKKKLRCICRLKTAPKIE